MLINTMKSKGWESGRVEKEYFRNRTDVESADKVVGKQTLGPLTPRILEPFFNLFFSRRDNIQITDLIKQCFVTYF